MPTTILESIVNLHVWIKSALLTRYFAPQRVNITMERTVHNVMAVVLALNVHIQISRPDIKQEGVTFNRKYYFKDMDKVIISKINKIAKDSKAITNYRLS